MTKVLYHIIEWVDQINEQVGRIVSWLNSLLVVLVCFDVLRRSLINDTEAWIMELEWHLFALIFLLAAGYTFKHNKHVRVDLFYSKFSKRDKAWVNLLGSLFFFNSMVYCHYRDVMALCFRILVNRGRLSRSRRFASSVPNQISNHSRSSFIVVARLIRII